MTWKCGTCGFEANAEDTVACLGGCGTVRKRSLVLLSSATGREVRCRIDTTINRAVVRTVAGDDAARFASDPQFSVAWDEATGDWRVRHAPGAQNPTCIDGVPVPADGAVLRSGSILSIGADKAQLTVQLA